MLSSPVSRRLISAGIGLDHVRQLSERAAASFTVGSTIPTHSNASRLVASGWVVARHRTASLNQILRIYLPGDLIDDAAQDMPHAQLVGLTKGAITEIPGALAGTEAFTALLHSDAREKSRQMVQHVLRLGRMDAYHRTAHFLLEIDTRWRFAYPDSLANIPLAMKQPEIGDYLSLSSVHVNRTLMALRRDGLIELRPGLTIVNHAGLQAASKMAIVDATVLRVP